MARKKRSGLPHACSRHGGPLTLTAPIVITICDTLHFHQHIVCQFFFYSRFISYNLKKIKGFSDHMLTDELDSLEIKQNL